MLWCGSSQAVRQLSLVFGAPGRVERLRVRALLVKPGACRSAGGARRVAGHRPGRASPTPLSTGRRLPCAPPPWRGRRFSSLVTDAQDHAGPPHPAQCAAPARLHRYISAPAPRGRNAEASGERCPSDLRRTSPCHRSSSPGHRTLGPRPCRDRTSPAPGPAPLGDPGPQPTCTPTTSAPGHRLPGMSATPPDVRADARAGGTPDISSPRAPDPSGPTPAHGCSRRRRSSPG